jgi:hypothetical protein
MHAFWVLDAELADTWVFAAEGVRTEDPCKFMRACNHYFSLVQTDCLTKLLEAGSISKMDKPLFKGITYEANLKLQAEALVH